MKIFKPKTNSWHYKLVSAYARDKVKHSLRFNPTIEDYLPQDFCSYWRTVIGIILGFMFLTALAVLLMIVVGALLLGTVVLTIANPIYLLLIAFIGIAILYNYKNNKTSESGLLRMKYETWKHKYCAKVEYDLDTLGD